MLVKAIFYIRFSVFLLLNVLSVRGQDVVFFENFNNLESIESWSFDNKVEYAHFLGIDQSNYIRFSPVSIKTDLISPTIALSAGEYQLSFFWNQAEENVPDSVNVSLSLNDGKTWKRLFTIGMGNQRMWQQDSVSLGILNGDNIKIMFTRRGQRGFPAQYLNLDNFEVKRTAEVTSVKNNDLEIDLSIYPNPNSGIVRLNLYNPKQYNLSYRLYNTAGQEVVKKNISNNIYLDETLNLEFLPAGQYFFAFSDGINVQTYSIIKQ